MTESSATHSAKGDPQGPSIRVDSGTPSSTGPPAASAPAAPPGEPAPEAALLSTGAAAPSARDTAVATAAGSAQHPSPESQSSSDAGSLSRSGTSTSLNLSHMGAGFSSSPDKVLPHHDAEHPGDASIFNQELEDMRGRDGSGAEHSHDADPNLEAEPDSAGPSRKREAPGSEPSDDGQNKAKRAKR